MEKFVSSPAAEAAFEALGADLAEAGVELGKMFGSRSLMVGSKAIGCLAGDAVAFKLGRDTVGHAAAMALPGSALFDPSGMNRPFKDWVLVPLAFSEHWPALADAALSVMQPG